MRIVTMLSLLLLISACELLGNRINDNYEWNVSVEYRDRILDDWFRCDECVNGQLRRVQELGNTALEPLRGIVIDGTLPNVAPKVAVIESSCSTVFVAMTNRGLTPAESEAECIARYTANLERRYRVRAIEALLAIRTEDACDVIGVNRCRQVPPFPDLEFEIPVDRSTRILYDR